MSYNAATRVLCDISYGTKKEAVVYDEMATEERIDLTTSKGRQRLHEFVSHKRRQVSNRLSQASLSADSGSRDKTGQYSHVSIFWPTEYLQVCIFSRLSQIAIRYHDLEYL